MTKPQLNFMTLLGMIDRQVDMSPNPVFVYGKLAAYYREKEKAVVAFRNARNSLSDVADVVSNPYPEDQ